MSSLRAALSSRVRRWQAIQIYRRFREFTMISAEGYIECLRLARGVRQITGCVVECGVWRGGMIGGLVAQLGRERHYYLFDSFEGLPPARQIDGAAAMEWQQGVNSATFYDNCSAREEFAERAMELAGATRFSVVKGWFEETVPGFPLPEPIAFLHLDADWYDSTMVCLESLFDRVAPGGLIVLDDYFAWAGCSRALHDFLSRRSAEEKIRSLGGTCYLVKSPQVAAEWP